MSTVHFVIKSLSTHLLGFLQDITSESIINRRIDPKVSVKIIDKRDKKIPSILWTTRDNEWVKVENYPLNFTESNNEVKIANKDAVNDIAPAFIITPTKSEPGHDWAASVTIPVSTAFGSKPDDDTVDGYNVFAYKILVHLHDTYVSTHYIASFSYNGIYPSQIPDKEIQNSRFNYWLVKGEKYKTYRVTRANAGFANGLKWTKSVNI